MRKVEGLLSEVESDDLGVTVSITVGGVKLAVPSDEIADFEALKGSSLIALYEDDDDTLADVIAREDASHFCLVAEVVEIIGETEPAGLIVRPLGGDESTVHITLALEPVDLTDAPQELIDEAGEDGEVIGPIPLPGEYVELHGFLNFVSGVPRFIATELDYADAEVEVGDEEE